MSPKRSFSNHYRGEQLTVQLTVRLPAQLVEAIEAHLLVLRGHHPGLAITRADTIRALLQQALQLASLARTPWDSSEPDPSEVN